MSGPVESGPLLDTVRAFAFPRFPGTDGERKAADLAAARLEAEGLSVTREPFRASLTALRRLRFLIHGVLACLVLTVGLVAPASAEVGAFFGISFLLLGAGVSRWSNVVESAFDRGSAITSENVVGRRAGRGEHPLCFVFLAHLDSKSARLATFWPSLMILVAFTIAIGLTLAAVLSAGRGSGALPAAMCVPLAVVAAAALLASPFNPSGNESPGAMDNASGLAVLLEAARTLPADVALADAELVFLATGAEEIGLAGAMRWIQAHEKELDRKRTVFVNVDSVGVGRGLIGLNAKGHVPGGRSMASVVKVAARASGVRTKILGALPGVGVDTIPIASRGFATVTIVGQVLGSASRRIHSPSDTIEHLNETGLVDAATVVGEIARTIALSAPR